MKDFTLQLRLFLIFVLAFILVLPVTALADIPTPRETANRFYGEVVNGRDFALLEELLGPGFKDHSSLMPGKEKGMEKLHEQLKVLHEAFPDYRLTVQQVLVDGAMVTARVTLQGTQKGPLPNIPATGKRVYMTGIEILRTNEGKIVERWASYDLLGVLRQMDIQPLLQAPSSRAGPDA